MPCHAHAAHLWDGVGDAGAAEGVLGPQSGGRAEGPPEAGAGAGPVQHAGDSRWGVWSCCVARWWGGGVGLHSKPETAGEVGQW